MYIYKNVNYVHKINGGSTAENVICHRSKTTVSLAETKYRKYLKALLFGLFPQIRTLFTFPNPLPPDRKAEGIKALRECSPKLSGSSLWMYDKVQRVIICIRNLHRLFHPKGAGKTPIGT